ncbi:MAG: MlaD family protein [Myxococcota bacterium]
MITRSEKIRLGIFLVASGVVLIISIVVLAGLHFMEPRDIYKIRYEESVSGLEVGAQVKFKGVRVGQVIDIQIDPKNIDLVIVTVALREGTPIKRDTEAVLTAMGITGLKFIELTGGSPKAENLPKDEFISAGASVIGTLEGKAQDIAVKIELALNKINTVLSDKAVREMGETFGNVNEITANLSKIIKENDENINTILANLSETSKDLREGMASARRSAYELEATMKSSRPKLTAIINNINETTASFKGVAKDLSRLGEILSEIEETLDEFNKQLKKAEVGEVVQTMRGAVEETHATLKSIRKVVEASRENIYRSSESLRKSLKYLEEFSAEIRDNPSLILSSDPPPEKTPPDK